MTVLLDSTTAKVDGTDLATTGVAVIWAGSMFDALDPAFESISFAGADVSETSDGNIRPTTWTVTCRVTGTGFDDAWSKIRALRRRTKPGRDVTLTRYMPGGESDTLVSQLATARRVGDTVVWTDGAPQAVVATDFTLLSPWHPSTATSIASASGSVSVDGDIRTEKMTITFSAAATLTNSTNGAWLTVTGAGDVDVEDFWESTVLAGFNRARPFRLEPGSNTLVLSAGTASIDYYPAYL